MAFGKKKAPTKVKYDQSLLDRIDNIKDDKDFSPYSATKKQTMSNQQAFDDSLYNDGADDDDTDEYGIKKDEDSGVVVVVVIVAVMVIAAIAAVVILI